MSRPGAQDEEAPLWRRALRSRFVLVPGTLAAAALAWNAYVSLHNGGLIEGRVTEANGAPVAGAEVVLLVQNVTTFTEKQRTRTGPDGVFRIEGNASHRVQVMAESPAGRSPRRELRLWFAGQDTVLEEPLVVARSAT